MSAGFFPGLQHGLPEAKRAPGVNPHRPLAQPERLGGLRRPLRPRQRPFFLTARFRLARRVPLLDVSRIFAG
jgi:hypothetical protein